MRWQGSGWLKAEGRLKCDYGNSETVTDFKHLSMSLCLAWRQKINRSTEIYLRNKGHKKRVDYEICAPNRTKKHFKNQIYE